MITYFNSLFIGNFPISFVISADLITFCVKPQNPFHIPHIYKTYFYFHNNNKEQKGYLFFRRKTDIVLFLLQLFLTQ